MGHAPIRRGDAAPAGPAVKYPRMADPRAGTGREYGCYIGPLGILLLCLWPMATRQAWPWAVSRPSASSPPWATSHRSPWTVMHRLPVMSSMRVPSRFIIPFAFSACLAAGFTLNAIQRWSATHPRRIPARALQVFIWFLVATSLWDSWDVGNASLDGTSRSPRSATAPAAIDLRRRAWSP